MSKSKRETDQSQHDLLKKYYEGGVINALEMSAAESVMRLYQEQNPLIGLGVAFAHAALRVGHLAARLNCLSDDLSPDVLRAINDHARRGEESEEIEPISLDDLPPLLEWRHALRESATVWSVDQEWRRCPLVLDGDLLFTYKSWRGEVQVAHTFLKLKHIQLAPLPNPQRAWLRLFGEVGDQAHPGFGWFGGEVRWDRARLALYTALKRTVTIIHGGPGTGKTTLTQRILAALIEQYDETLAQDPAQDPAQDLNPLRIALTAPTGKAAQRLTESIRSRASFFHLPKHLQEKLEGLQGQTLHRLLGVIPGKSRSEYHENNPLPYDVIVVDEASMVDTWLMCSLMRAIDLRPEGINRRRLLFIGDPHQLPSVSAGSPFSELCADRGDMISQAWLHEIDQFQTSQSQTGQSQTEGSIKVDTILQLKIEEKRERFSDHVITLNQVHRVSAESGVHKIAELIQRVDEVGSAEVIRCLLNPRYQDISLCSAPPFPQRLFDRVTTHYMESIKLARVDPRLSLKHLKGLCLLSPHYGGPLGVYELNDAIEQRLRQARLGGWGRTYVGRPILVTQNHPPTGLVNGDVGVIGAQKLVYFESLAEPIHYDLLPAHQTVYTMSVHKSQGSEFRVVVLCLPPERSPILTRELIYTGMTRAKEEIIIVGQAEVLQESIEAKVERGGQLASHLNQKISPLHLIK